MLIVLPHTLVSDPIQVYRNKSLASDSLSTRNTSTHQSHVKASSNTPPSTGIGQFYHISSPNSNSDLEWQNWKSPCHSLRNTCQENVPMIASLTHLGRSSVCLVCPCPSQPLLQAFYFGCLHTKQRRTTRTRHRPSSFYLNWPNYY